MPRELRLYKALQRRGLKVEYVPGWSTRGSSYFAPFGALAHWTAGPTWGDRPSLNVCVNGRPGVPGPLCQVFGARDGTAVVVAAGRANHSGAGYHRGADGNTDVFGCEMEWSGRPGELTPEQEWAYPRIMATFMDLGAQWICGHDEFALPKGRKVDVGSYIHTLRRQTYALAATPVSNTKPTTGGSVPSAPTAPGFTTPEEDWLNMDANELNKHLSRHAENVHRSVLRDLPYLVWSYRNEKMTDRDIYSHVLRASDKTEKSNHALGRMEPQLNDVAGKVGAPALDPAEVAANLAQLLSGDLRDAIREALDEAPERSAEDVADAVVSKIATRLEA